MSAHRQHFIPTPAQPVIYRRRRGPFAFWLLLILIVFGMLALRAWMDIAEGRSRVTAVHEPQVEAFQPAPLDLAGADRVALTELRLEAFRAGYRAAQQNNCIPLLAPPMGTLP